MLKRFALILAALTLLALLIGCSKPPEAEIAKANAALENARAAEAETYVPDSFRSASDALNAAMAAKQEQDSKFALFRSYGKSKEMFVQAEETLNGVATEAAAAKEKVRLEVTQKLADVKTLIESATAALAKAPRGKGSKADIELIKNDLTSVQTAYSEAESDFNGGKYLVAKNKLDSVAQGAQKIIDEIAAAKAKKMGK